MNIKIKRNFLFSLGFNGVTLAGVSDISAALSDVSRWSTLRHARRTQAALKHTHKRTKAHSYRKRFKERRHGYLGTTLSKARGLSLSLPCDSPLSVRLSPSEAGHLPRLRDTLTQRERETQSTRDTRAKERRVTRPRDTVTNPFTDTKRRRTRARFCDSLAD